MTLTFILYERKLQCKIFIKIVNEFDLDPKIVLKLKYLVYSSSESGDLLSRLKDLRMIQSILYLRVCEEENSKTLLRPCSTFVAATTKIGANSEKIFLKKLNSFSTNIKVKQNIWSLPSYI